MADSTKKRYKFDVVSADLTLKQKIYCHKYVQFEGNGTKAAIEAGYEENAAAQQSTRLLKNANVKKFIDGIKDDLGVKLGITRERIANELAKIAFYDVRKLYDENGDLIEIHKLDDNTAGAVVGVEVEINRLQMSTTKKVKISEKVKALDSLKAMLGYDAPLVTKVEHSGSIAQLPKKDLHDEK